MASGERSIAPDVHHFGSGNRNDHTLAEHLSFILDKIRTAHQAREWLDKRFLAT